MDHRAFLKALPAEVKADLTRPDDRATLARLALHGVALGLGGVWIAAGWPLWWLVLPVHGMLIACLFMVAHEATHQTLLANRRANDLMGHLAGLLIVLPFLWFRWFHMAHHRHTNDPELDPELQGGPKPETRAASAWHVSGLPYWWAEMRVIGRLALGRATDGFIPPSAVATVVAEARAMLVLYAAAALSLIWTPVLIWIWLVPVLFGQVGLRIFLLAEHADCPAVANMFENTRTTFTNRLVRLATLNASYHVEHHSYPQVPWSRLPDMHRLMAAELRMTAHGYAAFTRAYLAGRP